MIKKFNELRQGEQFRFQTDAESVVRTAQQIGKTEIYCPRDGDNTMGHSKAGGEEVYLKSDKEVIMIAMDVVITFKKCPPALLAMFDISFKEVATHVSGRPLEIPAEGLSIDFEKVTDTDLEGDLIHAAHIFVMAHSWIALKARENEG